MQRVIRHTDDHGSTDTRGSPMTAFVVLLMLFLALLTIADLLPMVTEPPRPV
jgi:hypothetical protein